jgi:uncharacterized membrane protein
VDAGHGAAGETDLRGSEVRSGVESTDALDRLIFFADAVFAIAMTLLVLAIPRPEGGTDVRSFLEHQDAGKFIAYLISFWVIALFWLAHHRLFRVVRRYDYGVLLLNLLVLFCIAFLPYPSAILGDHGTDVAATVFYALCVAATGAAFTALSWYVVMHRAFHGPPSAPNGPPLRAPGPDHSRCLPLLDPRRPRSASDRCAEALVAELHRAGLRLALVATARTRILTRSAVAPNVGA